MQVGYAKIMVLDEYLAIGSMTAGVWSTVAMVNCAIYCTVCHASVNLVYHSQRGRPRWREENGT